MSRSIPTFALVLALLGPAGAHAAARGVTVDGDRITVGDLAPTMPRAVLDIDVAPAPAPGARTHITRAAVADALRRAGADETLADGLPSRQEVKRAAEAIDVEGLTAEVREAALAELPLGVSIERVTGLSATSVPPGGHRVEVVLGRLRRSTTATVHVFVGTKRWTTQQATLALTGVAKTPVLRRAMAPGTTVTDEDVHLREVAIDELPEGAITRTDQLVGKRLRTRQGGDAPLRRTAAEPLPIITRGSVVNLVAQRPGFTITRQVVAQQDGGQGQVIRVKPVDDDTRTMVVTVHGSNDVRVHALGGRR
ncbi:MAG: flagellar basal body P-ring formation protein FlgA [Deltaproteobacteria bacterium]|nr:flagellar basal body P-ring formation protein FlgA [Deltaproteobacteria bacterium]